MMTRWIAIAGLFSAVAATTAAWSVPESFSRPGPPSVPADQSAASEVVATQQLTVPGLEADAGLGSAVAVYGDIAVVGAPLDDNAAGVDAGSAYVFRRSGTTWSLQQTLMGTDTSAGDRFGSSVDVYAGTFTHAVVGAPFDDNFAGTDAGSAYVFTAQGTTWSEARRLNIGHNRGTNDRFGSSVAIHRSDALVGVPLDDTTTLSQAGSTSAFYRPDAWGFRASLNAGATAGDYEYFGTAVDTATLTAVVGAPQDDGRGAAYVFTRPDDSTSPWTQQQRLTSNGGAGFGATFGQAVAVWSDTIVVVEPFTTADFFGLGYVHFYSRTGTAWAETSPLIRRVEGFGHSVAIDGSPVAGRESIVIGSPRERVCTTPTVCGDEAGMVYLHRRPIGSNAFTEVIPIRAFLWGLGFHFGWDVDVASSSAGDTVVMGSPHVNQFGVGSGSAYVVTIP